jgi:hypothetical protein
VHTRSILLKGNPAKAAEAAAALLAGAPRFALKQIPTSAAPEYEQDAFTATLLGPGTGSGSRTGGGTDGPAGLWGTSSSHTAAGAPAAPAAAFVAACAAQQAASAAVRASLSARWVAMALADAGRVEAAASLGIARAQDEAEGLRCAIGAEQAERAGRLKDLQV